MSLWESVRSLLGRSHRHPRKRAATRRRRANWRPAVELFEDRTLPSVLGYATYLGGSQHDFASAIALDAAGNVYLTGSAADAGFPVTAGSFDTSYNGGSFYGDAFVAKFDAGGALVWSTYLGGSADDRGTCIAVDVTGNVYVTGNTVSSNFPTTAGAFDSSWNGGPNGFDMWVAKLNPAGSALLYSTYLGGSNDDFGTGGGSGCITVDASGNAYVAGHTRSSNYPTTAGAFQTSFGGGLDDVVVTKLNPSGTALVYSTYLGGSSSDRGHAIALDAIGNAYVSGMTASSNFPTANPLQATYGGSSFDGFVTKLNPSGSGLVYSTYLGGNGDEAAAGIAVNAMNQAYVLLGTSSTNLVTTAGAFQTANGGGGADNYVVKLDAAGAARLYATYLGGSGEEFVYGFAVDAAGNAYMAGGTTGNYPTASAFQPTYGGGSRDGYVSKLTATGTALIYSSYLGGSALDHVFGVAADGAGNAFVAGYTESSNFPITPGAFDTSANGLEDAFWAKIASPLPPNQPPTANAGGPYFVAEGGGVMLNGTGSDPDLGDTLTYAWDLDGDANDALETSYRNMANSVFSAINEAGSQ